MGIQIKTPQELEVMMEGGKRLTRVKNALKAAVQPGVNAMEIEMLARDLIKKEGAEGSFNKVPGYSWVTCISVNSGLVHGIPKKETIFKSGDVVSVDVGLFYKGFHSDTSITIGIDVAPEVRKFLNIGQNALEKGIAKAKVGNHIYDISKAIESTIEDAGYSTVKALVGHGLGRELHEDPQIPCFVPGKISDSPKIVPGMALAIEVMYAMGTDAVEILEDGWTIAMRDGKISALYEESVAITEQGPKVMTR